MLILSKCCKQLNGPLPAGSDCYINNQQVKGFEWLLTQNSLIRNKSFLKHFKLSASQIREYLQFFPTNIHYFS